MEPRHRVRDVSVVHDDVELHAHGIGQATQQFSAECSGKTSKSRSGVVRTAETPQVRDETLGRVLDPPPLAENESPLPAASRY